MENMVIGGNRNCYLFGDLPKIKKFMAFLKFLLTQDHIYGAESFKMLFLLQFSPDVSQKLWGAMGKYRSLPFLAISQELKTLWHFEILTWELTGNHKMWNIWKKADRRLKQNENWRLAVLGTPYVEYLSVQVIWVHFGIIRCKSQNFQC